MLLLDTCALLWLTGRAPMARPALTAMLKAARAGELFISPISAWEIGMLVERGRLQLRVSPSVYVERTFKRRGFTTAPLTPAIAVASTMLPGSIHGDPADRMLVATAREHGFRLATRDRAILEYGGKGFVDVVAC